MTVASTSALYREVAGDGSPVVLVHAGICDSRMWEPQWEPFAEVHRVVRYDLRGYGRSPYVPGRFSHGGDLVGLLEELDLGRVTLVGASMGGNASLQVTAARPDLVSRLVLVGSGVQGHPSSESLQQSWAEEAAAFERGDLDAAVEVSLTTWVDGPNRSPGEVDPEVRQLVATMQRRALELEVAGGEGVEVDALVPDILERLSQVAVPTLVLVGEDDVPDMQTIAERLEHDLPDVRRASIAGAAHLPSLERPQEFNELVLPFLAGS